MTVQELFEALAQLPPDSQVILQKDAEGNGFSPLVGAEVSRYEAETTWSGQALCSEDDNYEERGVPCVVLWPVN